MTASELAESMLKGREETRLSAKQADYLRDLALREQARGIRAAGGKQGTGWMDRARVYIQVGDRDYTLCTYPNGGAFLCPASY